MFRAILLIDVFNGFSKETSTKFTTFSKEISLPFTPYAGLKLQLSRHRSITISDVSWDVSASFFRVYITDRFAERHGVDEVDYDQWLLHFIEREWLSHGECNI
jgi:hypothetical protein